MTILADYDTTYKSQAQAILEDYKTFLRFPSISTEPEHASDIAACLSWLSKTISDMGMTVETWATSGHPTLFAHDTRAGADKPTLLIYNHYDVQPVDPLEEWTSPPFEPQERDGELYARGASDNKGQCFYVLQALKLLYAQEGKLPINIKWIVEGEEEAGSMGLTGILEAHKTQLQANHLVVVDMGLRDRHTPTLTLGVRGIVTIDVEVTGSSMDLHSGSHGGIAYNPLHALVQMLAALRDDQGKVAVPGFYDGIVPLTDEELAAIDTSFDTTAYQDMCGAQPTGGEQQYTPNERAWLRPTLEINGIGGGYSGEGFKTVIPAKVTAKISCRLVPGQDPEKVGKAVTQFIQQQAPEGIDVSATVRPGYGRGYRASATAMISQAAAAAYEDVFGKPCIHVLEGGSIPIVYDLAKVSGAETVLMGVALPDDRIHAPNEHFGIDRLKQGCMVMVRLVQKLAGN